jgi:hypothetical protein
MRQILERPEGFTLSPKQYQWLSDIWRREVKSKEI